ncbi:hypothetical protein L596_016679 [Steinernema carpocapsae]|uniref:Uncharacterized protein n=1 Tax=Steinernema carpocapsae TaxID=34508 RepID=A0A4U5NJI2_STECR|nr:hypothetical protein L596_016679 [Steinernema carpocapsae]
MRNLGHNEGSKEEARRRRRMERRMAGVQLDRQTQQRLAPRRHEAQGRHRNRNQKIMVFCLKDDQRQCREVAHSHRCLAPTNDKTTRQACDKVDRRLRQEARSQELATKRTTRSPFFMV